MPEAKPDPMFEQEAMRLFAELAVKIAPYRDLKRKTRRFNELIRIVYGLAVSDPKYVANRLDAHHIIEDTWHKYFKSEMARVFGWQTSDDMAAIALSTEWHIRSGDNLSSKLGLRGAEGHVSLSKMLQDHLFLWQPVLPRGRSFKSLANLVNAYEEFYRSKCSPSVWGKLQSWFQDAQRRLR